jgi:PAS domain S-box-containing protein
MQARQPAGPETKLDPPAAERAMDPVETAELQLQVGLLQHLPVSAWTLKPDGTPDFVNQVWLEFSGQTLDFVRSHPEAWMTAVHPDDREGASKALWEGVRSGQGFAFETRSLRARDGVYRWHLQQAVVLRDAEGKVLRFVGTTTDIDDQKRAQEELRASENNLRQILDGIPGFVFVAKVSPAGQVDLPNQRFLEYFGRPLEEVNAWPTNDLVHPDDLPRVIAEVTHSFASGTPYDSELRYRRADGVYRWFQVRIVPVRDTGGSITRWYGLITDIEDRKRAEDELERREASYRVVVETASDAVVSINERGEIILANPATKRIFGYNPEELIGKPLTILMPGAMRKLHEAGLNRYLETGTRHLNWQGTEFTALRANGEQFPAEVSFGEVAANQRKVFTGFIRDISEKKRSEEALRASETNLRQILDSIPALVCTLSPAGNAELVNQQVMDYFGITVEELNAWSSNGAVHPDDLPRVIAEFTHTMTTGARFDSEIRYRRADGVYRWFRGRIVPSRDAEGRLARWYALITDIDDRKRAEDALSELRSELAHMSRVTSLGALAASIAHEVNQPLAGIVTNASTCLRTLSADPPDIDTAREVARRMIRDSKRASDVIARLRTLSSKKEFTAEPVDLNEAAREVIALCLDELQRNRVVLRQELANGLPRVVGDRVQLQQVILNLLLNASDAMSGVEDRLRELVIRTERDQDDHVRLTAQDAGVGIDPDNPDRPFEAFYTTKSAGMGMGLSISRSIIESHRGRLWAAPNDGPGASFSFSIPLLAREHALH